MVKMVKNMIEFKVELGETDTAGLVWYPHYFHWFDRAAQALLGALGYPPDQLLGKAFLAQPVIDAGCRFARPLRYGDKVRIETVVSEVTPCTFRLEHVIYHEDEVVGSGYEVRVWINIAESTNQGLKIVAIPKEIAASLKA